MATADAPARTCRVAAVQVSSANGAIEANLSGALPLVEQAADRGAELVALPEFLPTGYLFSPAIWDAAEPAEGTTVRWLRHHARRLGIYLGTSFLEAAGDDFFNTFVLASPDGTVAGRVRKQTPAAFEAFFTAGEPGPHVIETALGRIGVGICYENVLAYTPRRMHVQAADLLLMPHSAPTISIGSFVIAPVAARYQSLLERLPVVHATCLGVPAIMVNKCGPWHSPLPGVPLLRQRTSFPGLSSIADAGGELKAKLGAEPGVLVADVTLDPAKKARLRPEHPGRWCMDLPPEVNVFRVIEAIGSAWYRASAERKRRARAISGATQRS